MKFQASALVVICLPIVFASQAYGQFSDAIEDNSFYIEEAYNQEAGVVQHITTGSFFSSPQKDILLSFTQEWPAWSQDHQLSFTIPYASLNGGSVSGIGDILLNYRYQFFSGDDWAAVAPRLSAVLPTGSSDRGLGLGVLGVQFNLPVSKRLTELVVTHINAGATLMPLVKGRDAMGAEVKKTLTVVNVGASVIVLASARLNVMLEEVTNFVSEIGGSGNVERSIETILSPGLRYAIDVDNLQIVPGVAVPMVFSEGEQRTGVFFYLSFEHPF